MKIYITFFILLPLLFFGQTQSENYIKTTTYKKANLGTINNPAPDEATVNVTYFDGLGRTVEQIGKQQSNSGNDIITPVKYDIFGRQAIEYLPFASSQTNAAYIDPTTLIPNLIAQYKTNYGTVNDNPFNEKQIESSPLNRILQQAAPGSDWSLINNHTVKIDYQTNVDNEVKLFTCTALWSSALGLHEISLGNSSGTVFYAANQLYKTVTKNENWSAAQPYLVDNTTEEFKDKEGRIVLKRTYDLGIGHDTYYVYDSYGNLTYVIPPKANGSISVAVLNDLCYQYKYDSTNRIVEKKLPGKQWEFIVYDKLDRVVASGPAFSPFNDNGNIGWLITKYDALDRPVLTGWATVQPATKEGRKALQDAQDTATVINENRETGTFIDGIPAHYSKIVEPKTFKLLTVNYYDDYTWLIIPAIAIPTIVEGQNVLTTSQVKGLATATWTRVATTSLAILGETAAYFYDDNARPIRNYIQNHLGGYTYIDNYLDFAGVPQYTITYHRRLSGSIEVKIKDAFIYSPQGRLISHTNQINTDTPQLMASNTYDELGQLITKKTGNIQGAANTLQNVNFKYNIRGWMTDINNITSLAQLGDPKDLFAFKINYNTSTSGISGVKALYNGNIAETYWNTADAQRGYGYKYDNLNRLTDATFQKATITPNAYVTTNAYNESLTYDRNGNIMSLFRNGSSETQTQIDNLVYSYGAGNNTNQLTKVVDSAPVASKVNGFTDSAANTVDDYSYDANGNMIMDNNKNITSIVYNHLNLPTKITFGTSGNIVYIYNAGGQKAQKIVTITSPSSITTTDYLGGYQYLNTNLQFFPTAEGYIESITASSYKYVFQYKDHLGNIRLSYKDSDGDGSITASEILEENNYYPFGLKHTGYGPPIVSTNSALKYKYNGKELQDELGLGMYDYGFRNYDPALGRWMNIDPLAEMSRRWSPYTYCYNNPVFFIDPDGMLATYDWDAHNSGRKGVYKDGDKEVSFEEAKASHGISTPKQEQYKKGDYVAVVNAPKGAGGFGHNALLVGNDDTGWVFISKEGRDEDENSNSGNNPLTGGRALDARKESFATINDFFADRDYSEYKEGVVIKIQSSTAEKGEKEMTKQALSKYSLIFNNCGQAVNETLNKLGIRTVDPDKYKVYGGYSAGAALYNGVVPNEMYYSVKQANKNVPRTILSRK